MSVMQKIYEIVAYDKIPQTSQESHNNKTVATDYFHLQENTVATTKYLKEIIVLF